VFAATSEPPAAETPLADVLALFPAGEYPFTAVAVEGAVVMTGAATLTHALARPVSITGPAAEAVVDADAPLTVGWLAPTMSLDGMPVHIVAYQVVVVKQQEDTPTDGAFRPTYSVHVPHDTRSVTVPAEFLEAGSAYAIDVLALEASGNRTLARTAFTTR
jgi:hypothetical protein